MTWMSSYRKLIYLWLIIVTETDAAKNKTGFTQQEIQDLPSNKEVAYKTTFPSESLSVKPSYVPGQKHQTFTTPISRWKDYGFIFFSFCVSAFTHFRNSGRTFTIRKIIRILKLSFLESLIKIPSWKTLLKLGGWSPPYSNTSCHSMES